MRDINSTFTAEKNARSNQPISLYTLFDYDGMGTNLYLAEDSADVDFDGKTYSKFPITYEFIEERNSPDITPVEIRVSNVSRLIESYLQTYDLRGKKITITTVYRDQLADTDAKIVDTFFIDSWDSNQDVVIFICTSKLDILHVKVPLRDYSRNHCPWKFKDVNTCKYSGPESTCNKSLQQCRDDYSNAINFGGMPSVPTRRING